MDLLVRQNRRIPYRDDQNRLNKCFVRNHSPLFERLALRFRRTYAQTGGEAWWGSERR